MLITNNYRINGEIKEIHEGRGVTVYPTRYNEANDVYIVRACTSEEFCFFPTRLEEVPQRTLAGITEEYCNMTGNIFRENLDCKISYNKNRFYAVVSFNGKTFTPEEVDAIVKEKETTKEKDNKEEPDTVPTRTRKR
jgi:hypothetical protein